MAVAWLKSWLVRSLLPLKVKVVLSRRKKIRTVWQKLIRLSPTSRFKAGSEHRLLTLSYIIVKPCELRGVFAILWFLEGKFIYLCAPNSKGGCGQWRRLGKYKGIRSGEAGETGAGAEEPGATR